MQRFPWPDDFLSRSFSWHQAFAVVVATCAVIGGNAKINAATITWSGASGTANWNTNPLGTNWGGGPYADLDDVHFAGIPGATAVSIQSAGVSPTSVTFDANTQAYSFTNQSSGTVGITGSSTVTKNGTATVTFSSPMTYSGATTINAGTLSVIGANTTTGGRIPSTTVTVNPGAALVFGSEAIGLTTTYTRYGNSTPMFLNSGTLQFGQEDVGVSGTASIEDIGILHFSGASTIDLRRNTSFTNRLQLLADEFRRNDRGTLSISINRTSLTAGNDFSNLGDASHKYFLTATVVATRPTVTNGMVSPYFTALAHPSNGNLIAGFVNAGTQSGNGAPGSSTYTFFASTYVSMPGTGVDPTEGNGTQIVDVTSDATINNTRNIYALRTSRSITGSGTLQIGSGGLIIHNTNGTDRSIETKLNFNTAEAVIWDFHTDSKTTTISGNITAGDGFTKSGPGTLILSGNNAFTVNKPITLNQGILQIGNSSGNGSTDGSLIRIVEGATLSGNGAGSTFGTLKFNLNETADTFDLINVLGTLDITNLAINFNVTGTLTEPSYLVADYSSATGILLGSQFASVVNLPANYVLDYTTGDQIRLNYVPEPTSLMLFLLGAIGFIQFSSHRRLRSELAARP